MACGGGRLRGLAGLRLQFFDLGFGGQSLFFCHPMPLMAGQHRIRNPAGNDADRAARVIVAGYQVIDSRRIAVGIDHCDDLYAEAFGLGNGDRFLDDVHDIDGVGEFRHGLDATEVVVEAPYLRCGTLSLAFCRGVQFTLHESLFQSHQIIDSRLDSLEVGHEAAEPPTVHIHGAASDCFLCDDDFRLLLGADEQYAAAAGGQVGYEFRSDLDVFQGYLRVEDVDLLPLLINVGLHLGMPALGWVADVDTSFEE